MKILLVCKSLPHRFQGGIQTHVWQLSEQLVAFGHTVSILTAGSWQVRPQHYRLDGRHIIEIPYFPFHNSPILPTFLEEWSFNRGAARWLEKNGFAYDIIHLQGRSGFTFQPKNVKTPIISTLHGFIAVENRRQGGWLNLDKRLHQVWASWHERRSLRTASKLIAISDEIVDEIKTEIKNPAERAAILAKTTTITTGVKSDATPTPSVLRRKNAPFNLLFVGRLERIKGVYPLLQAMRLVKQPVNLTFIGDGTERFKLIRQAIRWGLLGLRVEFVGALPHEAVLQELKNCDALILPAFHDPQGLALMEANACGKPVLASDIAGIRSVVTHAQNGWLLANHNPQGMAAAIDNLAQRPQEAQAMGEAGYIKMRLTFDWEKIVFQTLAAYQQILRGHQKNPLDLLKPMHHDV
jgi:glycosyltransferase involved in cell wall biosynthesis